PKILLEAMAMAKPIVTTDNVGCREVVEEGRNGFLVPVRNAQALADRMDALLSDPEMRARFGQYSRIKAAEEFADTTVVKRVLAELYAPRELRTKVTVTSARARAAASPRVRNEHVGRIFGGEL